MDVVIETGNVGTVQVQNSTGVGKAKILAEAASVREVQRQEDYDAMRRGAPFRSYFLAYRRYRSWGKKGKSERARFKQLGRQVWAL